MLYFLCLWVELGEKSNGQQRAANASCASFGGLDEKESDHSAISASSLRDRREEMGSLANENHLDAASLPASEKKGGRELTNLNYCVVYY